MKNYCGAGQTTDDSMAYAYCMLDTCGYKYTYSGCVILIPWHFRHFLLYRIQCRVTFDTNFRTTGSNVELHSTPISSVPDPMLSYFRHQFPLYRIQCRVTFDANFRCTGSNFELHSALSAVPDPMSSYIRHYFPLNQI